MRYVGYYGGPPRGLGEQGNKALYFRGTRKQKSKTEGIRGTKAILGNREHRKSILREHGKNYSLPAPHPPPGGPHYGTGCLLSFNPITVDTFLCNCTKVDQVSDLSLDS